MAKLIVCRGLPGSGKSTWAAQQAGFRIVNKDDIRAEMKKDWNYDVEKEVQRVRDMRIASALSGGHNVISTDTNLAPKHEPRLREIAKKYKAEFVVNDSFLQVPIEECIKRDAARDEGKVGERVIRDMAEKFLRVVQTTIIVPFVPDTTKSKAIICDLDGTLALHNGRSPYDTARCGEDLVNSVIKDIIETYFYDCGHMILYVSGREDKFMEATREWLKKHEMPGYVDDDHLPAPLMMRRAGDKRNDAIVKLEIFNERIRDRYNVKFVLDDRDRVVKMWRSLGLTCLQVAPGDF